MGTRNLTMVIDQEGTTKVAQYGQWDGYPSGVGMGVLSFLKDQEKFDKLKSNLPKVRFIDSKGRDKEFMESYSKNAPEWSNEPDNRTEDQKKWFSSFISRDLACEVLENIANSNEEDILLQDNTSTGNSDGWVEYCYVIDLQKNKFLVHYSIDQDPVIQWDLSNLPSEEEFLKLEEQDEEDEY